MKAYRHTRLYDSGLLKCDLMMLHAYQGQSQPETAKILAVLGRPRCNRGAELEDDAGTRRRGAVQYIVVSLSLLLTILPAAVAAAAFL